MMDAGQKALGAICGLYWAGSAWYEVLPGSCATQAEDHLDKICPIYACAQDHQVEHCGLCPEFPCILLVHMASQRNDDRIASAALRAGIGDELWAAWAQDQRLWTTAYCPLRTLS